MTRVSAVLPLSSFAIFPSSSFFRSRVIGPMLLLGSNESRHTLFLSRYRIFVCVPTSIRCSNPLLEHVPQQSSPPATGFLWLPVGDTPDMDGSGAMLRNPESHTFGLAVIGGIGSCCRGTLGCLHVRLMVFSISVVQCRASCHRLYHALCRGSFVASYLPKQH